MLKTHGMKDSIEFKKDFQINSLDWHLNKFKYNAMKNYLTLTYFVILLFFEFSTLAIDIYVSNNGVDCLLPGCGEYDTPVKTLKGAYDIISSPGTVTYNIILKDDGGNILVAPSPASGIIWTKSGTASFPINIKSESCYSTITRNAESPIKLIKITDANYISFSYINFYNCVQGGIELDNADYCHIEYCTISGSGSVAGESGGIIWVGNNSTSDDRISSYNHINDNIFYNLEVNDDTDKSLHQVIYISQFAEHNQIYNNSILDAPSFAIQFYHDNYNFNQASYNLINQNLGNGVGSNAFAIGYENDEDPNTIQNNNITFNYVHDSQVPVNISGGLPSNNNPSSESEQYLNFQYPIFYLSDPYWLGYEPSQITNKLVNGDFNGDGKLDDIAGIYDNADGTTSIHVWNTEGMESNRAFIYSGGEDSWWYGSSYTGNNTTGRVVNGDFDNDGKQDDIAAFYNYGGSTTQIHRWTASNNSFTISTFWPVSGYDVTKITNRVVSGDFDNDGFRDDIAAFYDYGSGNTRIHVWLGTPSGFTYQGSGGWWSITNGGYDSNKITNRVVCGDFDHDGFQDDIAAFFDYGSNNTRIHMWKSSGSSFTYSGSSGWWISASGGLNANLLSGRVVAGDFDNDNYVNDIAAFYDNGTGTNLRIWRSSGTSFTYSGNTGWWNVTSGYDTDNFTGRVVSGDFDRDNISNDITVFYDRTGSCGSLRTNVWQSSGTNFSYINNSMGYPWLTSYVFERSAMYEETISVAEEIADRSFEVFPNPFSNEITIQYKLETESPVEVSLYSVNGSLISTLFNEFQNSGEYQVVWNRQNFISDKIESGIYFVTIKTDTEIFTKKVVCVE
jgi:hypothetical protein